jgi:dihydropteroate synthase
MKNFVIKKLSCLNIEQELKNIGFDKSYLNQGVEKYNYINLKIFDLSLPQANILKQTALTFGADCAVNKNILTAQVKFTDCILGGSLSQLRKIAYKLKFQPFSMKNLSEMILSELNKQKEYSPKIVGILNLTKNSFSDGGMFYDFNNAVKHIEEMVSEGADIIDIGAESTKPYSKPVEDDEQLKHILPVLKYINDNNIDIPISIDTRSAKVACESINEGAKIINDVSGLEYDEKMIDCILTNKDVKIVIQHSLGTPENMQVSPCYNNVVDDIWKFLYNKVEMLTQQGVKKENIIVDVGIGFGKTQADNFELIKRIEEFQSLGCEIMLGISRKSFLNMETDSNEIKDIFTVAINSLAIERHVDYLRVHNVGLHKKLLTLMKNFNF